MEIQTIDHFHGQDNVTARFRVALEAAWNDATRLPHMLFTGPPGTGKTSLAHIAAREMGVTLHERIGQVLCDITQVNGLLMNVSEEGKDIVFIDEAHEMPRSSMTLLYRAMEDGKIFLSGMGEKTLAMPIPPFTLLAATTDEYSLLAPLRDRFKLILPFQYYSEDSLAWIAIQRARMMGLALEPNVACEIAKRSRGTPRLAIRLLEACHRYCRSLGETELTERRFSETVAMEGVDHLGLGPDEQRFLQLLAETPERLIRLHSIEAALGVHRRTLQTVIEPFLLRMGLIERREAGRQITPVGLEHLGLAPQRPVAVA